MNLELWKNNNKLKNNKKLKNQKSNKKILKKLKSFKLVDKTNWMKS